jgi:hypothetical protein
MKKFERFIIYPMLFIALFFSFVDDEIQQTTAQQVHDEIIAKNIKIVDDEGRVMIELKVGGKIKNSSKSSNESEHYIDISKYINEHGVIELTGNYENSNYDKSTKISSESLSMDYYGENNNLKNSMFINANRMKMDRKNNSYIEMSNKEIGGSNITIKNTSAMVNEENASDFKQYKNFIQIGINETYGPSTEQFYYSFYPSISFYYDEIKKDKKLYHPTYDNLRTKIYRHIELKQKNGDNIFNNVFLANLKEGGTLSMKNKNNSRILYLGPTAPNEKGQRGGHGLIGVFDKYGEDWRSYDYK